MENSVVFDINAVDRRIAVFCDYYADNTLANPTRKFRRAVDDPYEKLTTTQKIVNTIDDVEEKLFFIFLASHFNSPWVADQFYDFLSWDELLYMEEKHLIAACELFFVGKNFRGKENLIGGHRKYFRCLPEDRKVDYTVKILLQYVQVIEKHGSQAEFFELHEEDADFYDIYTRMLEVVGMHTHLARFDHTELVSRCFDCYVVPDDRFYSENSSGPLHAITYMFFGKRYWKDVGKVLINYAVSDFVTEWNDFVTEEYTIPESPTFKDVISSLERWIIMEIRYMESLPVEWREDKAFVFDVESCLCNWQKKVYSYDWEKIHARN